MRDRRKKRGREISNEKMGEERQVETESWTDCKRQTGRGERATAR